MLSPVREYNKLTKNGVCVSDTNFEVKFPFSGPKASPLIVLVKQETNRCKNLTRQISIQRRSTFTI